MCRNSIKKTITHPFTIIVTLFLLPLTLMVFILSDTPFHSLYSFFSGPIRNSYSIGNMLNSMAPLMLTSLGAFIALRANAFNLGGEGQVYLGMASAGTISVLLPSIPLPMLLLVSTILPALMTLTSGILEVKYRISSLISTYLISMLTIKLCNYLIGGPFLSEGSNILETTPLSSSLRLVKIMPPSNLSLGFIISLGVVIISSVILRTTKWGYKFTLSGSNSDFSKLMGINSDSYKVSGLLISGFFHGLAGALLVCGEFHSAIIDSYNGLGWDGLSSGLLAGGNPLYVILTSLFYSYIDSGAQYANLVSDITLEISVIIKSLIFFVISSKLIKNHFIKRGRV